jgi:hypothetical protein
MSKKPSISQVVALLEFFARFHPAGLGLLLGQVEEPSAAELTGIIYSFSSQSNLGVRIGGGLFIPEAERVTSLHGIVMDIIDSVGGWEHIHKITREVKNEVHPNLWRESADYAAHITPGGLVRDGKGGMGGRMFRTSGGGRHGICERTARRRFRNLMRIIALKILSFPPDGGFALSSSTDGGYPS